MSEGRRRVLIVASLVAGLLVFEGDAAEKALDTMDMVDRYTAFLDEPKEADKRRIILAGGDLKCEACEIILEDIMYSLKMSGDEDAILAAMEADELNETELEAAVEDMEKHVVKKKRGCNRLYKDNLLLKGYAVKWDRVYTEEQQKTKDEGGFIPFRWQPEVASLKRQKINASNINLYSVESEAAHYACEHTVAKYRDDLAGFLSNGIKKVEGSSVKDLVSRACKKVAKCDVRRKDESLEFRAAENKANSKEKTDEWRKEQDKKRKEKEKAKKEEKKQQKKLDKRLKKDLARIAAKEAAQAAEAAEGANEPTAGSIKWDL